MESGWFGTTRHLLHALATVHADRDAEGHFLIVNQPVVVGLGGDEAVVHADCSYLCGGQPQSLAGLMNATSYGMKVAVL